MGLRVQGFFLTDLHLLSRRSVGQQLWESYQPEVSKADVIVLGGDIFDLRWSKLRSMHETIDAAEEWLELAIAKHSNARWIYLLGNHDCHPSMQSMLTNLSNNHPNFEWTSTVARLGNHLFLHGDILDAQRHRRGLEGYRSAFHEERPKGRLGNLMYSAVIYTRLHGVIPMARHPRTKTCSTLLRYLRVHAQAELAEAKHIYFGHTHVPMIGFRHEGYSFHNAGSGIRHLRCAPAKFEL